MQPRSEYRSPSRSTARLFGKRATPTATRQATTTQYRETGYIRGLIDGSNPPRCCDALSLRRQSPGMPRASTHRERSEKSGSWPHKNQSHHPTPGVVDNRDSCSDISFAYHHSKNPVLQYSISPPLRLDSHRFLPETLQRLHQVHGEPRRH